MALVHSCDTVVGRRGTVSSQETLMDDLGRTAQELITSRAAVLANPDLPTVTRIELALALRETLLEYVQDQTKTLLSTLLTNEAQE